MEAGGTSSDKHKNIKQIITDVLGTTIAISTLTLPIFFIMNLSQYQLLDQSLQHSKVITWKI